MTTTWKCDLCGYVHNGPDAPDFCPVCGAEKSHFSPLVIKKSKTVPKAPQAWQCSICDHVVQEKKPPGFCPVCGAATALFHPYETAISRISSCDIQKLVILGAGIAGMTAAEEARQHAPNVEITLVSREKTLPYFRLNLTRFLAGEVAEEDLLIQHQDWFDVQKIHYIDCASPSI